MEKTYLILLKWKRLRDVLPAVLLVMVISFYIIVDTDSEDTRDVLQTNPRKTNVNRTEYNEKQTKFKTERPSFINNEVSNAERRHIAFLKVHKAASSTIQNILYRFGSRRQLSFVLPYESHYISQQSANSYNRVLPPIDNVTGKYDILCNHVIFNQTKFKQFMYDDAVYVAIVREPMDLFISAAYYYKFVWPAHYLKVLNATTFIHDLITKPEAVEQKPINRSRTFNYMAKDFGLEMDSIQEVMQMTDKAISSFVADLTNIFKFVMVVEQFDESLVMLRRYLNWSFKDILFIKQNEFKHSRSHSINAKDVLEEDKLLFRKRNRVDYAIYEKFLELFLQKKMRENDLDNEVKAFRIVLNLVQNFCLQDEPVQELVLPETKWNDAFVVDRHDCQLMMTKEIPFWTRLKQEHKQRIQ